MENKQFPQYLHKPYKLGPFEIEQLYIMMFFLIFGLMSSKLLLLGVVAGPYVYFRAATKYPRGFMMHSFYMTGLLKLHGYPDYFEKKFSE